VRVTTAPDAPADGLQLLGAEEVVPAYSEREYCIFGTYTGPDMGIHSYDAYQGEFGHHVLMLQSFSDATKYPDGTVVDCTDPTDDTMINVQPFVVAPTFGSGTNTYTMPDGMAASIKSGNRYMIQSHYVNTSANDILVRDVVNIGFMDPSAVQTWAAPIVFTRVDLTLPPQQTSKVDFDCTIDGDYNLMFLFGHMHEWGTSIEFGKVDGDTVDSIMDVNPWQKEYRDAPPISDYSASPLAFHPGDVLHTTCNWNNDTDKTITFPGEMCAVAGMAYPSKLPVICSD
jgi:hypothetical protein